MAYSGYTPGTSYTTAQGGYGSPALDNNPLNQLMALQQREQQAAPVAGMLRYLMANRRPIPTVEQPQARMSSSGQGPDTTALQLAALQGPGDTRRAQMDDLVGTYTAPTGALLNSIGGYTQVAAGTPGARASGWVRRSDAYAPRQSSFAGPMGPSRASLDNSGPSTPAGPNGSPSFRLNPEEIADFSRRNFGYGRSGVRTNVAQGADYSGQNSDEDSDVRELIGMYNSARSGRR